MDTRDATTRALRELQHFGIGVCGKIGAGKTTFGRHVVDAATQRGIAAAFMAERRHTPLLDTYIKDPAHFGFPFQLVMANDAVNRQEMSSALKARGTLSVVERPVLGNRIFADVNRADGHISDRDYAFYQRMLPLNEDAGLDVIVYLHASYSVALDRMRHRGDVVEQQYDENTYLERLDDAYFVQMLRALARGRAVVPVPWDDYTVPLHSVLERVADFAHRRASVRFRVRTEAPVECVAFTWQQYVDGSRVDREHFQCAMVNALYDGRDVVLVTTDQSLIDGETCALSALRSL